ncbi:MAG TPA: hypothetical protein VK071_01710 [Tissierellales bacterium]|nr:hypothetical protein [Tissierellales bacterium]
MKTSKYNWSYVDEFFELLELEDRYKEILYIPVHGIELVILEKRI